MHQQKSPSTDTQVTLQSILEKIDALEKRIPPAIPGSNFKQIGSKFYLIEHDNAVSWHVARENCQKLHSQLANFANKEEFLAVIGNLRRRNDYWITINDLESEGTFLTEEGFPPQFTKWHGGEPSNGGDNEDCVQLKYMDHFHLMNDRGCDLANPYICEFVF